MENLKKQFTKKIARQIALYNIALVIDSIQGTSDFDYTLESKADEFEQNFTEDLEEKNIIITEKRIKVIADYFEKYRLSLQSMINKRWKTLEKQNDLKEFYPKY